MFLEVTSAEQVAESLNYSRMLWEMFIIFLTWFILLLGVGYNKNRDTFNIFTWFETNITRFIVGIIVTVILVFLNATSEDISNLLRLLGFTTEKTTISFGIAIAAFLIGGLSPKPVAPPDPNMGSNKNTGDEK